jgi:hypothetical protein
MNGMKNTMKRMLLGILILSAACTKRDVSTLQPLKAPIRAAVFIDDFTPDLQYAAFGGSDVKAFDVDREVTYNNTTASMRFNVPDANAPQGSFAGGVFLSNSGRDLSGFNALTFFIKASQPATVGSVGFGNDFGESKFVVTKSNLKVNTIWKKVIIPIPDASKLTAEKGLMFVAAGPENGRGYTFWIDEVKFEKLTTLAHPTGYINKGVDREILRAENGETYQLEPYQFSINLPEGVNDTVGITPHYFSFTSSAASVATVSETGAVRVASGGTTNITAKVAGKDAKGSLKLTSIGAPLLPPTPAPTPTKEAANVLSLYSNSYSNVPVNTFNTRWQFSTAEESFVKIGNDDVIRYKSLNFVGIEFTNPTINASSMGFFHMDIWTPDPTALPNNFKILLVDFGPNGAFGGGDDSQHEITINRPQLVSNNWVSIDVPMSTFTGLTRRANLAQLVLSGSIPNVFVDNIYFYKNPVNPPTAAPTPTVAAANVISLFSDAYTNAPGTDFNPNWGQSTAVSQVQIGGNNTLYYANFNYQGIQLGSTLDVSGYQFLHLHYYTTNATTLRVFLISAGPVETPFTLNVPTSGWNSINIPLSAFAPVNLKGIIQLKFEGSNGSDVFLDNIYFSRVPIVPPVAAPTPTYPAANVISIYSDAYTNVPGNNLNPNWGQATVVTETAIQSNQTLVYTGLNYQGLEFGSPQNVSGRSFLHLDYYSANATALEVFLISPGPVETPYKLTVPTNAGWNSVDIPLSAFAPVALNNVFQMKFVGNGTIYLDNILFR